MALVLDTLDRVSDMGGLFYVVAVVLFVLGVLWSPLGTLLASKKAGARGLSKMRYGLLGLVLSVTFLFPWFFLRKRIEDRRPRWVWEHGLIHLIWAGLIVHFSGTLWQPSGGHGEQAIVLIVSTVMLVMFIVSLVMSVIGTKSAGPDSEPVGPGLVIPFIGTLVTLFVLPLPR